VAAARWLKLRLLVEGVEVPVIGARISIAENAPCAATIQIVPLDQGLEFHARSMVHLFAHDIVNVPEVTQTADGRPLTEAEIIRLDDYKLCFYGLLIGFRYMKQGTQRTLILQCLDASIAWDTTYQFMLTYGPRGSGIMGSNARMIGANTNLFDDIINDPASVVGSLLQRKTPKFHEFKQLQGLLAGLVSVIEAVGGIPGDFKGVNDFNTVEELRNKLLWQIATDLDDTTGIDLFNRKVFSQWLTNSLGGGGGLMSIRDILRMVGQYITYSMVPCPAPYFTAGGEPGSYDEPTYASTITGESRGHLTKVKTDIEDVVAAIEASSQPEDESTVLWSVGAPLTTSTASVEQSVTSFTDESAPATPTEEDIDIASMVWGIWRYMDNTVIPGLDDHIGTQPYTDVEMALADIVEARTAASTTGSPTTQKAETALRKLELAKASIEAALNHTTTGSKTVEYTSGARLNTQIFRPDIWFAAPPRCNVLFPEHYNSFSLNRQLLRECTRYQLRSSMELIGPDELLDYFYYAPDLSGMLDLAGSSYYTQSAIIMPHEVHSGIVPKMHSVSEVKFYANKAQRDYVASQTAGTENAKDVQNSWAQRVAHHNFFRFRFAPRVIQFSGQFNYLPVCGFPMAILDKPMHVPDGVSQRELIEAVGSGYVPAVEAGLGQEIRFPTQFLGLCSSMEIVADQQGGYTSGVLNFCRAHRSADGTDDEYLNMAITEQEVAASEQTAVVFILQYDQLLEAGHQDLLDLLKDLTPNPIFPRTADGSIFGSGGVVPPDPVYEAGPGTPYRVLGVEPMDDETGERVTKGSGNDCAKGIGDTGVQGPIHSLRSDGVIRYEESGSGARYFYYDTVVVTETIDPARAAEVLGTLSFDMPAEEALRPPWVSPHYGNKEIGEKIYQVFFGTGSLVDEHVFAAREVGEPERPVPVPGSDEDAELLGGVEAEGKTVATDQERFVVDPNSKYADVVSTVQLGDDASRTVSVAQMLDALAIVYGYAKEHGGADKMAWNYIHRPVATLKDILGGAELEYDEMGRRKTYAELGLPFDGSPDEGFHSRAVAPLENLHGLLTDEAGEPVDLSREDQTFARVDGRGKEEPIAVSLDQRIARRDRVLAYVKALKSRAMVG